MHLFFARTTMDAVRDVLAAQVREHGWPRAGTDPYRVCRIVAEQTAQHPDAAFRAEGLALAEAVAATGDVDPEHLELLAAAVSVP